MHKIAILSKTKNTLNTILNNTHSIKGKKEKSFMRHCARW